MWDQIHFKAGPGIPLTQADYVGNLTQEYRADPAAFEREFRAAFKELAQLFDTNDNFLIEKEEIKRGVLRRLGHNETVSQMKYFDVYKQPNGVPFNDFVEAWVQFRTNDFHSGWEDPVQETLETMDEIRENN